MAKAKIKYKKELFVNGAFEGTIAYTNIGMRHPDEEEICRLNKGDKVYIYRKCKEVKR